MIKIRDLMQYRKLNTLKFNILNLSFEQSDKYGKIYEIYRDSKLIMTCLDIVDVGRLLWEAIDTGELKIKETKHGIVYQKKLQITKQLSVFVRCYKPFIPKYEYEYTLKE